MTGKLSGIMNCIMNWISNQLEYNKMVRRIMVLWALTLSTYATIAVYTQLELASAAVSTIYATTLSLMGVVAKFYFDSRDREDLNGKL